MTPGCSMCERMVEGVEDELDVGPDWCALPSADNPGWVWLATRRHGSWSWDMSDPEAASFGAVLRQVSDAVRRGCSVSHVYVLALGENTLHFHLLVIPRVESLGADVRASIRAAGAAVRDPTAAAVVAARVRSELQPA